MLEIVASCAKSRSTCLNTGKPVIMVVGETRARYVGSGSFTHSLSRK